MMQYDVSNRMKSMKPSIIREILKQMSDPTLISFAGGNPSPETFPKDEIIKFSHQLLMEEADSTLQYSITEGLFSLRTAVKGFANRRKDEQIVSENDEVLIISGSQQAMNYTAKCLCNEGDIVAAEDPAFLGAQNAFYSYGASIAPVPMQSDGVDLNALESVFAAPKKPKFFYCIPNFQNPTGITTSAEKRKKIYELAVKYGVPILEDDPYGELRFTGERINSIKSLDKEGIVIYAGSFSKIMCPGMRIAYCVCPKQLSANMVIAKQVDDVHTNVWAQKVCERILTTTNLDEHIKKISAIYAKKASYMADSIKQKCDDVTFLMPQGGMFIWADLKAHVNVSDFTAQCLEKKLAVVPGFAFCANGQSSGCNSVRLNFSTPTNAQIDMGTDIMANVLKK